MTLRLVLVRSTSLSQSFWYFSQHSPVVWFPAGRRRQRQQRRRDGIEPAVPGCRLPCSSCTGSSGPEVKRGTKHGARPAHGAGPTQATGGQAGRQKYGQVSAWAGHGRLPRRNAVGKTGMGWATWNAKRTDTDAHRQVRLGVLRRAAAGGHLWAQQGAGGKQAVVGSRAAARVQGS